MLVGHSPLCTYISGKFAAEKYLFQYHNHLPLILGINIPYLVYYFTDMSTLLQLQQQIAAQQLAQQQAQQQALLQAYMNQMVSSLITLADQPYSLYSKH